MLWEDRFDRSGRADAPRPGAIAVSNGLLFVVGHSNNFNLWVVRAYDTANGTLIWQDQFAEGPGLHGAESLVVERGRVFVGGFANNSVTRSAATMVRAYDAHTGRVLWQQKTSGPDAGITTLRGLGFDGLRVFAGGTVANSSGKNVMLVQALDAQNGALVWEDRVDNGGVVDAAFGIAVRGRQVFAQGFGGPQCLPTTSPPSDCAILLRSYDGQTGALLWDVKAGTVGVDDQVTSQTLHAQGGTLFGAWGVNAPTTGPQGDWLVQAYEAFTGQLRWEDLVDTGGGVRIQGAETPLAVAMFGGRLFVAGRLVDSTDNWNFVVRAYHAAGLDAS